MKNKFYITTPVYYVNDVPHIGHAYTTIAADVLARAHREQGDEVFLLAGTDEHGLKIQKKAEEAGEEPQKFVDKISASFESLWDKLEIQYDGFIRTTDDKHKAAVVKVLQKLFDAGAIYKGEYEGLYCVGCEQFKTENELVNGRCADHDTVCETIKEESYLLKMTDLQDELIEKIEKDEFAIKPEKYKKEVLSFLKGQKLKDISISRKNVKWGIPLPFDQEHTTYVWFDAFLSYLTGLGWDGDLRELSSRSAESSTLKFWPADVQLIGKDILRVHATIWPIMLMHLGIELPKVLYVHGHILSGGRKMSKTIGNVIGIDEMLEKFGVDAARYLLMSIGTFGEDVDATMERMTEKYNADLANGIGNLVSRVLKMSEKLAAWPELDIEKKLANTGNHLYRRDKAFNEWIVDIKFDMGLKYLWDNFVRKSNLYIEEKKPWELANSDQPEFEKVMRKLLEDILFISFCLKSVMPATAEKIDKTVALKEMVNLFPRKK